MDLRVGIDIGSTTVKVVVLDEQNKLLFRSYERHYSKTVSGPARPCTPSRRCSRQAGEIGHHRFGRIGCGQRLGH